MIPIPTPSPTSAPATVLSASVIGAGPAGLMAAQALAQAGISVDVYDRMPSVGRKFLLAGRGGLNLTHAEPADRFVSRYSHAQARERLTPLLNTFGAQHVRDWAQGLGIDTFVGTSSRIFPTDMKAAPLLRAWLHRLRDMGVRFHMRHHWLGWDADGHCLMQHTDGSMHPMPASTPEQPHAVVLALGGASWARLGSDGSWMPWLQAAGALTAPLQASNCGFDVRNTTDAGAGLGWSEFLSERYAGQPVKPVALCFTNAQGEAMRQQGEFVLTQTGVEGSLIYAFSAPLRDAIAQTGQAIIQLDLLPDHSAERVLKEVQHPRGGRSLASHLKSRLGLSGLKMALLHEVLSKDQLLQAETLAATIKALPLTLAQTRPIDEAISTAGGVAFDGLTDGLMLQAREGVFCAGEMLDWEAPTGGYLLTACLSTGQYAGQAAAHWLAQT